MEQEIVCDYCGFECTVIADEEFYGEKISFCPVCGEKHSSEIEFEGE